MYAAGTEQAAEDTDGHAFRTAARFGLTLRFHGRLGTLSAYEVVSVATMRKALARAEAFITPAVSRNDCSRLRRQQ